MKVNRDIVTLKKLSDKDDGFVDASPQERISMVWELTKEAWNIKEGKNVEQRLQRDVAKLIKNMR